MASTIKFNLGTYDGSAKFTEEDLALIKINVDGTVKSLVALEATLGKDGVITIPGYGKLSQEVGNLDDISFVADANCKAGTYQFSDSTGSTVATWDKVDMGAMTGSFTLSTTANTSLATLKTGTGNDVINTTGYTALEKIDAGAGDDTITFGEFDGVSIKGGAGKDAFIQGDSTKAATIEDYKYAEGDTVKLAGAFDLAAALDSAGKWVDSVGGVKLTVQTDAVDNVYQIKVTDSTAVTQEFWTAKAAGSVVMDGSKVADAMVIDATKAVASTVQGGFGDDDITLGAGKATLNIASNAGNDTVTGFKKGFEGDVINLVGSTLKDVKFGAATNVTISGTEVTLDGAAVADSLLVQENGGTVKKVAFSGDTTAITVAGADVYVGNGTAKLNLSADTTEGAVVNLYDTDKYINIASVDGGTKGGIYIGNSDKATTFNLSAAKGSVQVLGGSKDADSITLDATKAAKDTVWFGSTEGLDVVTNFDATVGFGEKTDVLYLYDVEDLTKVSFKDGTSTGVDVKVELDAKNAINLAGVATSNVANLQVQDKAGNVQKLAFATADGQVIVADGADRVFGIDKAANTTVQYTAKTETDLVVSLYETDKYKNINHIDISAAKGKNNIVIGAADAATNISLAGGEGVTNEVLGGSNHGDSITSGTGATDVIWFGAGQGADTVSAFANATDKVRFYDTSVAELASAYKFDAATTFTSATNKDDVLTLTGLTVDGKKTMTVIDKDLKEVKVAVGGAALTYDKDAKVYFGSSATVTTAGADSVAQYLGNGVDGVTITDTFFSGVKAFDASSATGDVVLIGSKSVNNTLTGGKTNSALYGGGASSDIMIGHIGAVDQFWFGTGDGVDSVTGGADGKDTILLHNITSIDDIKMTVNAGDFVITAKDGSSLTVTDAANAGLKAGLTFQFGVDASAQSYTYDTTNKKFVAK